MISFPSLTLSNKQIDDIFPFYFIINRDLKIMQLGRSLAKLYTSSTKSKGLNFEDIFVLIRPSITLTFDAFFEIQKQVFVLEIKESKDLVLRGQFEYIEQYDAIIFVGSPWFHSIEALSASGLNLSDFAIQDPIIDLLHIAKTHELTTLDVTELLKTLKTQKKELQRLSLVAAESLNAVIITDADGYIEWINKAFTAITDFSLEDVMGKKPGDLLQGPLTDPETIQYMKEQIRKKEPFVCEIINYTKAKEPYWIYLNGQPLFDNKGKLTGFFAIEEDITDRKIAESKLKYSEEKYRSIIENMELGLLEVNNEGIVVKAYPRFCTLVGYRQEELVGQNPLEMLVPTPFHKVLIQQALDRAHGDAGTYEIPLIHKDGHWIWVLISGAPIYNETGEVVGSIGIHYDLTDRKLLEERLANAKKVAEDARYSEQQFLANMSHEIRTPLNAIIGMSHLLYDTKPSPEQREYVDILSNSANFLHTLISNILDMAKIEAGKIEMNPKSFDLKGMISTIQKTFQLKLEDSQIDVEAMIDSRINGNYIGDEMMLHQILMNLLSNAEKFTEGGIIEIIVKQSKKEENKVWIEFQVNDTGIGMTQEDLAQIFEKFKQIQGAQGKKYKGTGLGLSIVKELVEIQGGVIEVKSEKDKGSSFKVILPFLPDTAIIKQTQVISQLDTDFLLEGMHLLMVEDNVMNRKYLGKLLEKKNISFDVAVDGLEAVQKAQTAIYNVILMDIQMPNMNGYEATLSIRNTQNPNKQTPIIALTASAMLDQKDKAFQVGMNEYISKPFTPNELYEKLVQYKPILKREAIDVQEIKENQAFQFNKNLNQAYLEELYGTDFDYALAMFQTFVQDIFPEFNRLLALADEQETADIAKLVHQIKPTTAMVGLTDLEKLMQNLENSATKEANRTELRAKVKDVYRYFESKKDIILAQLTALENQNA